MGHCARLSDPRPRLRLWLDRKAPRLRHGHPGQTDRAPLTMAERFRRAPDWVHPSRMPGPDHCLRRGASAPDSALLRELLQQSSDAPVTQQRRAGASSDSAPWRPKVTSCSRWTTSPIHPNLVFGTDKRAIGPIALHLLDLALAEADYGRTVKTLLAAGGESPVITKPPSGAYTYKVFDAK